MTNNRANEIFRTKYPTGKIYAKGEMGGTPAHKYAVAFKEGGKVYDYSAVSYVELLTRFDFFIMTPEEVEYTKKRIAELEMNLEMGYEDTRFFGFHTFTEEELGYICAELENLKNTLDNVDYIER